MNVMMGPPLVLMNSIPDGCVLKKRTLLQKLKAFQTPLTVKQSAKTMMIVSFSTIMSRDMTRGSASFIAAAASSLNMTGVKITLALLDPSTQIWMTAATLNCNNLDLTITFVIKALCQNYLI